jgi:hypothetical protein
MDAGLAAAVVPYVVAAAEVLGEKVLDKGADAAAEGVAGFGARLIARLLRRGDRESAGGEAAVELAVRDLVAAPSDPDVQAAARVAVRKLLAADPVLAGEVRALLAEAPQAGPGERSIVIGEQSGGLNITGDRNKVRHRDGA